MMVQSTLPTSLAFKQLTKLYERYPEMVDSVISHLLKQDDELLWSIVVGAYLDGEINLGKAAELLETHELVLRERFIELGIPLRIGPATQAEAQAEAAALRSWLERDRHDKR